jgi:hypothetical protein
VSLLHLPAASTTALLLLLLLVVAQCLLSSPFMLVVSELNLSLMLVCSS